MTKSKAAIVVLESPDDLLNWKYTLRVALEAKGLWEIVNGTWTAPAGTANLKQVKAFKAKQQEAMKPIVERVGSKQLPHIRNLPNDPATAYARLTAANTVKGIDAQADLWDKFHSLHLTPDISMMDHVGSFRDIADRLGHEFHDPVSDPQFILALLRSLPNTLQWQNFRRSLRSDLQNDDLEHVISCLYSEYHEQVKDQKGATGSEDNGSPVKSEAMNVTDLLALVASFAKDRKKALPAAPAMQKGKTIQVTCHRCGGRGHYQADCATPATHGEAQIAEVDDEDNYAF